SEKSSEKSSEKILALLREDPTLSASAMARRLAISQRAVEKQVSRLRAAGRLRRVGPDRGGQWEVTA
ncbi:MAG: winged helix-turn-helix transcriptional regulator, partial [Chloroflexi bacterium]|nr:winged helix-turn-helix transcriptional regulator [Chloroflexota bacterium]